MHRALYSDLFGQDRPLRHYTQHLIVATIGFVISRKLFLLPGTLSQLISFLIFSLIIDIDGFISLFTLRRRVPETRLITQALLNLDLRQAAILATTHHKKLNRLLVHNVIGLVILVYLFRLSLLSGNVSSVNALSAVLSHFIFDIFDDFYQLGHLHNWLWPLEWLSARLQNRRQI